MRRIKNATFLFIAFIFASSAAIGADRHWVGSGPGVGTFWDRTGNWSATAGGPSGASVPTASDNVFIDGGGNLTINANASCLSFSQTRVGDTDFKTTTTLTVGTGGFSLSAGTFFADVSNITNVAGNFTVSGGTFNPGTGTVNLNGSSTQAINTNAAFYNLTLNNAAGFTLSSNATVNNTLTFTSGIVQTGANTLIMAAAGTVSRTSGHVFGNFQKNVATGATSVTYQVGGVVSYAPVTVAFGNVTTAGTLTVASQDGDHPNILSSNIHPALGVNRYWTLTNGGVVFNNYSGTFNFTAGDLDPSVNTGTFISGRYATGSWNAVTVGASTPTSTQATGLTGFGDFAVGNTTVSYTITATASAGGSITPSGSVGVNYGNNQSFTITPTTGYHIDSVVVDGANQGVVVSHDFTNVTATHTIAAYFSIDVLTITASASAGGSITPSGSVSVNYGNNQSFAVTPNTGYHIDSVVVDGANQGAVTGYDFTGVTTNHTIASYFSIDVLTITASASAGGSITPSGSVSVNYGNNQSFAVTPNTGYHIDSVVVDGANQGAVTGYDFTGVTTNHTIASYFSIDVLTITASASAGGSITPSGSVSVNYGNNQSFAVTPNTGYHIDSVVVDGANQGAVTGYDFTGVTTNHAIEAYFSIDQYLVAAGSTSGGSITPSGAVSVDHGNDQGFTITPATGYYIADVHADTVSVGPVAAYTFNNVTANHSIYATFAVQTFPVAALAGPNGSISPAGVSNVDYDASIAYTITPATGYYIADVHVDSVSVGPLSSYTFNNVTAPHLIEAAFAIRTFTVTGIAGSNGSITPAGATTADYGDTLTYAISAGAGYFIADVHVDSVSVGAVVSYAFNGITADHLIEASFSLVQYSITASATTGGTISPPGAVAVGHGEDRSFTIAANSTYHLDSVLVDGVNVGTVPGYDFTSVTSNHTIAAYFSIDTYTIAASAGTGGSITPSGSVTVAHGADQAFAITPATGYYVADVHVDTVSVGAVGSYTFNNVTEGHSIVATFALQTFSITAVAGPNGIISPPGVSVVNYGDTVTYSITPDTGYFIADLTVDSVSVVPSAMYTFAGVTADHVIGASFSLWQYTITASSSAGGTISPSGTLGASHGGARSFTMTANTGYHLDSVLVDGANVGAVATYDFTNITADHSIAAYFSINVYTVVASSGSGGGITPSGTIAVTHGASTAFTITPATGYLIADVLVDSVSLGSLGGYTFNNVTSNHTIHAVFAIQTFTITALAGPNGSVSPSGTTLVNYGDSLTITLTPDSGYYVAGVEVDSVPVGAVLSYSFTTITANHLIEATFGTNAPPTAVSLIAPVAGDSIAEGALVALAFTWNASSDANPGDTLVYSLNITGPGVDYNATGLADTTVTLDLSGVLAAGENYAWTVSVSDGQATVASADTFSFHVSPATGVEDGMSVPTVYALGQNYPNPFNPTTVIPFDLPERSTVTLKVFNILGVEVLSVVVGESIPAGNYKRSVNFSGLSSGAYFYKLSAAGESGKVFERVMKLVVLR